VHVRRPALFLGSRPLITVFRNCDQATQPRRTGTTMGMTCKGAARCGPHATGRPTATARRRPFRIHVFGSILCPMMRDYALSVCQRTAARAGTRGVINAKHQHARPPVDTSDALLKHSRPPRIQQYLLCPQRCYNLSSFSTLARVPLRHCRTQGTGKTLSDWSFGHFLHLPLSPPLPLLFRTTRSMPCRPSQAEGHSASTTSRP